MLQLCLTVTMVVWINNIRTKVDEIEAWVISQPSAQVEVLENR